MTDEIKKDTVDYNDQTPFDSSKLQSISEISKAIRHKMYGADTREAIAQQGEALVKLMQETGGNPNAEVMAARGNHELLQMREDAQDNAIIAAQSTANSKFDSNQAEAYLKSITAVPETFADLAAIKSKYPRGKNGLMVAANNGHKYIWAKNVWTDAGIYQSVGIADGAVGWKKRTPVGSQAQVQYFGAGKINFDFENKIIVIPKDTHIVVGKMVIKIDNDITTAIPTDQNNFFALTVSTQDTNFKCYIRSLINTMSDSEVVIAFCNNTQQTVEMNGDYLINGRTNIVYAQPVITYPANVTYKANSDGTMLVTFLKNDQSKVTISYPGVQNRVQVNANYTLKSSEALVYNSINNSLSVLNLNSLLPDSLIIIGNYHGNIISNNVNAVQGNGDYQYYLDGTENAIYYASTVTANKHGGEINVNFDISEDTRLFYKDSAGNHQMTVTTSMYTVPHNFSLVLNRETKSLEVINTDNIIRGVHSILIACHRGFAKKVGMYFNHLELDTIVLPTSGKIPINRYMTYVGNDATKVGDEYWFFDESNPDHTSTAYIYRINPEDFSKIGLIRHNLGHANGVDYRDNTLLVYNGAGFPPEINLYKNPDNTMTNLKIQDAANTQIIFKEGNKQLPGDGSVCFGLDNKIVYNAYCAGTQVVILKILLGLGDNDLSDKTTDKSDNKHWGSFISGKSSDDYNGTAQIIASYTGNISGDNQPQGMAFDGDLYIATSHSEQKAYQFRLFDDGSYKVVDSYKSEMTDYKNNVINLEPEITFIDPVKRSLFIGARGGDTFSLSNVAEFNL